MDKSDEDSSREGTGKPQARAKTEAEELAESLGEGWTPHVNDGFYCTYSVDNGCVRISPVRTGFSHNGDWRVIGYDAKIHLGPNFVAQGPTPGEAYLAAMMKMQAYIETLINSLGEMPAIK